MITSKRLTIAAALIAATLLGAALGGSSTAARQAGGTQARTSCCTQTSTGELTDCGPVLAGGSCPAGKIKANCQEGGNCTPAGSAKLLIVVAGSDKGASFLREAKPTLDRLKGSVLSAKQGRNSILNRDETTVVLSFPGAEAANSFMFGLAGAGGTGPLEGNIPDGPNHHCEPHNEATLTQVCTFKFGSYTFWCINTYGSGSCFQR